MCVAKAHSGTQLDKSMAAAVNDEPRFVRFTFAPGASSPFDMPRDRTPVSKTVAEPSAAAPVAPAVPRPPPYSANTTTSLPVRRLHISQLTPERFEREFRAPGVPLVIEGALSMGPHWQLQSFEKLFTPDAAYQCRVHGGDAFATSPDMWRNRKTHARHVVWTSPGKFAETIAAGIAEREDCYMQADIQGTVAGDKLVPDLTRIGRVCGFLQHQLYGAMVNMWWGPPNHTEPLHMDVTDGTLCQLHGRKHIYLFPPSCWRDLYPFPVSETGMSWAFAQVRQSQPDFERFPRLVAALQQRIELVLDEGEVSTAAAATT